MLRRSTFSCLHRVAQHKGWPHSQEREGWERMPGSGRTCHAACWGLQLGVACLRGGASEPWPGWLACGVQPCRAAHNMTRFVHELSTQMQLLDA